MNKIDKKEEWVIGLDNRGRLENWGKIYKDCPGWVVLEDDYGFFWSYRTDQTVRFSSEDEMYVYVDGYMRDGKELCMNM